MSLKQKLIWEAYFVIVLFFAAQKVIHLVKPGSPEHFYYLITRAFDPFFYLHYIANILHVAFNIIHCIPLFLYIHRIRLFNPLLWKCLFILRCIFEITGHSYEANTFTAFYHANPKYLLFVLTVLILPQIPSYVACYRYAFQQKKMFP